MKHDHNMMFRQGDLATGGGDYEELDDSLLSDAAESASSSSGGDSRPWVGADGSFAEGWTRRLPEELGEYRESLGKFKNVADMAKSYRELESKIGVKGTFVPGKDARPEEVSAFRKAMGIPDAPDRYNIRPEQLPEGFTWPEAAVLQPILETAHKYNIPEAALRDLISSNFAAQEAATVAMAREQLETGKAVLQQEWGGDYHANIQLALHAAKMVGANPNAPGFTDPETVMAFVNLARKIGDDQFVTSGGYGGSHGGASEARDIQTNPDNPKYKLYQQGDADTVAHVRRLLRSA